MTEKKAEGSNILAKKKDRSIQFLIGAVIFFLIATLVYKFLISPTLVNIDMYHQAAKMYDKGEYIESGKLFARLGSYKDSEERYRIANMDGVNELIHYGETEAAMKLMRRLQKEIQENGANTSEMQQYKYELQKKEFRLYSSEYEEAPEKVRYLYRDMDGDGSLECCEIRATGPKYMYTCKDGKIYNLNDYCDIANYVVSWLFEKQNLFSVRSLALDGTYYERLYRLSGTAWETVTEKIVVPTSFYYEDIDAFEEAMQGVVDGKEFELPTNLISEEYYYKEGEECSEAEYESYVAKVTENDPGIDGARGDVPGWEVENCNGGIKFYGERVHPGTYRSAHEFMEHSNYEDYEERQRASYYEFFYGDDYDYDDYEDEYYDEYDEDENYEEW